jgi:peptide/nickel transport system substrate-binding protein
VEWSFERLPFTWSAWLIERSLVGENYGGPYFYAAMKATEAGITIPDEDLEEGLWNPGDWEGTAAAVQDYWQLVDQSVVCLDDYTVQFNLVVNDPLFFYKMNIYGASIIDSEWAIDNGEWDGSETTYLAEAVEFLTGNMSEGGGGFLTRNVASTAAYKLVSLEGDLLVAEAFKDYWGGQPAVSTVQFKAVTNIDSVFLALQQGDADTTNITTEWALLEGKLRGAEGITIWEDPSWFPTIVDMFAFETAIEATDNPLIGSGKLDGEGIPPDFFADENVRKGFAHSFNSQAYIDTAFLGNGEALTMVLPPMFSSYDRTLPSYDIYDPEKAEAAFKAAFGGEVWNKGFKLTLQASGIRFIPVMEILKEEIEALNPKFRIELEFVSLEDFNSINDGQQPIYWALTLADYPNYDFFADYYGGNFNFNEGYDPAFNEMITPMIREAGLILDSKERAVRHREIAELAFEHLPIYVLPLGNVFVVTSDSLEGAYYNPYVLSNFYWKDVAKK